MSLPKYSITDTSVLLLCKLKDIFYPEDDHFLKLCNFSILIKDLKSPTQLWGLPLGGDVEVVVEVGDCAVPHIPHICNYLYTNKIFG